MKIAVGGWRLAVGFYEPVKTKNQKLKTTKGGNIYGRKKMDRDS